MTKYAKHILRLVNQSKKHMTAEQLFLELKQTEPKVVLATVYNNLNALCREGLIRKISMEGSPDRYDRIQKHDHLVCITCGALSDLSFEDLTEHLEKQLGAGIISYDLKVFYLCPKCRKAGFKPSVGELKDRQCLPVPGGDPRDGSYGGIGG